MVVTKQVVHVLVVDLEARNAQEVLAIQPVEFVEQVLETATEEAFVDIPRTNVVHRGSETGERLARTGLTKGKRTRAVSGQCRVQQVGHAALREETQLGCVTREAGIASV